CWRSTTMVVRSVQPGGTSGNPRWSSLPTARRSLNSSSRWHPPTAVAASVAACSTRSPPARSNTVTTEWPSTSTSATLQPGSTAGPASSSRGGPRSAGR
ncbi:MAG: hypothetical protein AVDCRST_MAG66-1982, partial [uncultured Pseudonocardia sp.]